MRTITKNLYTFDELSDKAKEKAIEEYRSDYDLPLAWQNEMIDTIKAIAEHMNCKYNFHSYDGIAYTVDLFPYDVDTELFGRRAMAYISNNWIDTAAKPKTYYLNHVIYCDGRKNWKRKSKIWFTIDDCPFTGYCADCCFSEAWKEWKQNFTVYSTVGDFIELVADKLSKEWTVDNEAQNSDDYIAELLSINGYEFTEDGKMY